MLEECDGSTAVSGYTDASSVLQTTIISDCGANGGEDDSWLMASKHGHLLPIDTDCLDVHEKPSELLERHLACETDSEHVLSSVVNESFLEARDDDQTERTDKEAVRDASASSHESGPKVPTDSYLESLHTRLESTHFRRDEKKEDFIDYLFEKIELLVCEMDGEQETLRDILDDTFEFLEDMSCGRTARRRNASIRASFERFLQSFDKLAAIYPQKSRGRNAINKTDMLDAIVDHFEKINCMGTVSDLVGEVGEFLAPITDATKAATGVVASAARNAAMTCSDTKDDAFSFMSISEETGELPMAHFTQRLPRISEEYSLTSWSSRSRSLRQLKPRQPKLSMQQVQQELNRRNNLKRMRSNIHVHLSKKTVVNKMMEAKETVEDVFEAAGDQLATIFENMEMGIWDMLVLGANSSVDSRHEVATSRSLDFLMSGSIEDESEMNASQSSTRMDDSSIPVPRVFSNSQTNLMDLSEVDETSDVDPALIHATSSEDTYASGCGAGHKGPTAKRFQMVDHMKKVRAKASTGRWTPDSNVTGSTCDETVSSEERGSPAEGRRELCSVPSDSVRLERMEMMAYMSIHDRSSVIDSSDSNTHSGRSYRALSLDACATEKITGSTEFSSRSCPRSALITTECTSALSARLEERPGEISFCSRMLDDTPSFEGARSMSIDDGKDLGLGKASNRSNRSVLVSSDDVTSMLIEQVDSIPLLSTSTDASFVTALQSMDLSEQEPPHVVNKSNSYKSQLLKNWSDQSLLSALEDYPDDELHRAGGRKNNARPPSSPSFISKDPYVNPLIVPLDDASSSSWAHVMTLILHGTKVGSGWVGKQAMNAMVMVLFVSASTAMAANGALKTKFQERRRQFEDKMMERHSNRSGRAGVTTDE
jgi:hypothetical protein